MVPGSITYGELLSQSRALGARLQGSGGGPGAAGGGVPGPNPRAAPGPAGHAPRRRGLRASRPSLPDGAPRLGCWRTPRRRCWSPRRRCAPRCRRPRGRRCSSLDAAPAAAAGAAAARRRHPGRMIPPTSIYTSGSTGRPKGVEVTHLGALQLPRLDGPGARADAVGLPALGHHHLLRHRRPGDLPAAGHRRAACTWPARRRPPSGAQLAALLQRSGATVMQATPSTWRLLLDAGWAGDPRLRILCGGEALPRDLADRLLERGAELWNLYGPTETTIWSALAAGRAGPGPGTHRLPRRPHPPVRARSPRRAHPGRRSGRDPYRRGRRGDGATGGARSSPPRRFAPGSAGWARGAHVPDR